MRLSADKYHFIKNYWLALFPAATVYLFGSRVHDTKKGGDIDLLILNDNEIKITQKINFLSAFMLAFDEQKVDLVTYTYTDEVPFKNIALNNAIRL